MKSWIVYDILTGQIIKRIQTPAVSVEDLGLLPTEGAIECVRTDGLVQDGVFVEFPEKPSPYHDWDWTTKSWLPNLDAARESQRQAWNAWRDRELVAGYPHNGHVFHSDNTFIGELQLLLKGYERGQLTGPSAIRTRDNGTLQMTHAEIEGLLLMIGLHRQAIYQQSWVGKDALAGLNTLEDIVAGGPPS